MNCRVIELTKGKHYKTKACFLIKLVAKIFIQFF
jgi:hypothetical protein